MAGKIIADIIEAPYDAIRMNVANVTVLTANSSGLTYVPTGNVNVNIGSTASLTLGNVTVSNIITASAIKFPATQVSSADGNTLDDYEEGTWTPQLANGGGSGSWGTRGGTYTKIGRLVTCQFNLDAGNSGTAGNTLILSGLPFTPASYTNTTVGTYGVNDDTSSTAYSGNILINGTTVMFYRGGASNGNRVSYAGGTLQFYI